MDREKVIKGQECCQISMSEENPFEKCEECPYNHIGISVQDCRSVLSENTLALLKEQEERIKNRDESLEKAREEIKWLRGMLKEQEPKKVLQIRKVAYRTIGYCPSCGRGLDSYEDGNSGDHITNYCYNCGQAVKWE